jgi:hypothetical protein
VDLASHGKSGQYLSRDPCYNTPKGLTVALPTATTLEALMGEWATRALPSRLRGRAEGRNERC